VEAASVPWRPLGELFVTRGLITRAELETALAEQDATGKRLGEILVERGLVSGPDLTAVLMDQLGVEVSKEEGFGSGLWAEIKRRHRRVRPDEAADVDDGLQAATPAGISLVPDLGLEPEPQLEPELGFAFEPEPSPELELAFQPEPVAIAPEPVAVEPEAIPVELEQELEELKAEYQTPAPVEPLPEPEPIPAFPAEPEPGPEPLPAAAAEPEPEQALPADVESAELRRELDEARADLAHLQEMLADAMTALTVLTAEAAGEPSTI